MNLQLAQAATGPVSEQIIATLICTPLVVVAFVVVFTISRVTKISPDGHKKRDVVLHTLGLLGVIAFTTIIVGARYIQLLEDAWFTMCLTAAAACLGIYVGKVPLPIWKPGPDPGSGDNANPSDGG